MDKQRGQLIPVTDKPYNAETPLSALLEELTPLDRVYVRNHFAVPLLEQDTWRLAVNGAVQNPLSFTYAEIQEMPRKSLTVTLECAGNGRKSMDPLPKGTPWGYGAVSVVKFTGTSLSNLLDKVGVLADATEVAFQGADQGEVGPGRMEDFARSLPREIALHPDTLLAWEINGEPLTPDHGFPVRLVVPGWYGMASVKWLERVTVLTEPFIGFFQSEHYVYSGDDFAQEREPVRHIRPRSLIASPIDGDSLNKPETEILGIAWSGGGPITKVEVSVDGGERWDPAKLDPSSSSYGVQKWRYKWTPQSPGNHVLMSRATDSLWNKQPTSQVWNQLGYGNNGPHTISVVVRHE